MSKKELSSSEDNKEQSNDETKKEQTQSKDEINFLRKIEILLENNIFKDLSQLFIKIFYNYKYIIFIVSGIILVFLLHWGLVSFRTGLPIIISIISLILSIYLSLRTPKCKIHPSVIISKDKGVFIELYSENKSSCIVNVESISLLKKSSNESYGSVDVKIFSQRLPIEISKSYLISDSSISTIPLVYKRRQKGEVTTYIDISQPIKELIGGENFDDLSMLIRLRRSDSKNYFDITIDFSKINGYKYK